METVKSPWKKGAFFVCEKCGRRDDGSGMGKDFADDVKKEFKSRLRDMGLGKDVRVLTSSCLSLCPKRLHVAAWTPSEGELELLTFDPRSEMAGLFKWVHKKAIE